MKDTNGRLTMSFELQDKLCNAVLRMPLKTLENIARALSADDYKHVKQSYKKGILSICTYMGYLALIIYDNDFMQEIFKE